MKSHHKRGGPALSRRRALLAAAVGMGTLAAPAIAQSAPRTFVFVHGSWHGGWCWRRVTDRLEKLGHKCFAPTLTGLGERSHLLDGKVNLTTHVNDVVNVFKWERLSNVVLCGTPMRAIRSPARWRRSAPRSRRSSISIVPAGGWRQHRRKGQSARLRGDPQGRAGKKLCNPAAAGVVLPGQRGRPALDRCDVYAAAARHLHGEAGAYRRARAHRQEDLYSRQGLRAADLRCRRSKLKKDPTWRVLPVQSGHDVMVDVPDKLVEMLLEAA